MRDDGGAAAAQRSAPRPAEGTAVDPIALEPVDDLVVTMADTGPGSTSTPNGWASTGGDRGRRPE